MVDNHEMRIILQVYSHQLTTKVWLTKEGTIPAPNMFAVSANEFANIIVDLTMKKKLRNSKSEWHTQAKVPPFMPQFRYTYQGATLEQGAGKKLQEISMDHACRAHYGNCGH